MPPSGKNYGCYERAVWIEDRTKLYATKNKGKIKNVEKKRDPKVEQEKAREVIEDYIRTESKSTKAKLWDVESLQRSRKEVLPERFRFDCSEQRAKVMGKTQVVNIFRKAVSL